MVGGRYPGTDGSWPAENRRNLAVGAITIVLIIIIGAAALYHKRTAGVAGALLLMGGLAIGYAALSASKFMASPQSYATSVLHCQSEHRSPGAAQLPQKT